MFIKKILLVAAMTLAFTQTTRAQSIGFSDAFFDFEIQVSIKPSGSYVVGEFNRPPQAWGDLGIFSKVFKSENELNFYLATHPDYSLRYMIEYVRLPETKRYTITKVGTMAAAQQKVAEIKAQDGYDSGLRIFIVPVQGIFFQGIGW